MRLIITLVALLIGWGEVTCTDADANWLMAEKTLASIDGQNYSTADYEHWWEEWRDNEAMLPEGVMPFIEWCLLVREAERMELASLPEYQHKIQVFLKARTLMALKNEEIDAKIAISEEELQTTYDKEYTPRRLVGFLEFTDAAQAQAFYDRLGGQTLTSDRLQQMAAEQPPPFTLRPPQWLRPNNTPAPWLPLLGKAVTGTLVGPLPTDKATILLHVAAVKASDPDDFSKKRDGIRNDLRKKQEDILTERLLRDLIKKYHVRIDEEVLKAINLGDPKGNDLQRVVIASDRSTVTVGYFLDQCRKEAEVSRRPLGDGEAQLRMKRQVANAMIANSLVAWEALDRHYEGREPLQRSYRFYRQNRLVVELENRTLGDQQITEEEALDYYQGHLAEFRHPELVRVVVVSGEGTAVRKVWTEAISGKDLLRAAEANKVQVAIGDSAAVPLPHLSAVARQAVAGLAPGELSQPFSDSGQSSLVMLKERAPGATVPYDEVAKRVKERLQQETRAKRKQEFVATLKSRSQITVNDEVWAELAKQYRALAASR